MPGIIRPPGMGSIGTTQNMIKELADKLRAGILLNQKSIYDLTIKLNAQEDRIKELEDNQKRKRHKPKIKNIEKELKDED